MIDSTGIQYGEILNLPNPATPSSAQNPSITPLTVPVSFNTSTPPANKIVKDNKNEDGEKEESTPHSKHDKRDPYARMRKALDDLSGEDPEHTVKNQLRTILYETPMPLPVFDLATLHALFYRKNGIKSKQLVLALSQLRGYREACWHFISNYLISQGIPPSTRFPKFAKELTRLRTWAEGEAIAFSSDGKILNEKKLSKDVRLFRQFIQAYADAFYNNSGCPDIKCALRDIEEAYLGIIITDSFRQEVLLGAALHHYKQPEQSLTENTSNRISSAPASMVMSKSSKRQSSHDEAFTPFSPADGCIQIEVPEIDTRRESSTNAQLTVSIPTQPLMKENKSTANDANLIEINLDRDDKSIAKLVGLYRKTWSDENRPNCPWRMARDHLAKVSFFIWPLWFGMGLFSYFNPEKVTFLKQDPNDPDSLNYFTVITFSLALLKFITSLVFIIRKARENCALDNELKTARRERFGNDAAPPIDKTTNSESELDNDSYYQQHNAI